MSHNTLRSAIAIMLQFAKDDFLPTKANSDSGPKSLLSYIMMACEKVAVKEL